MVIAHNGRKENSRGKVADLSLHFMQFLTMINTENREPCIQQPLPFRLHKSENKGMCQCQEEKPMHFWNK